MNKETKIFAFCMAVVMLMSFFPIGVSAVIIDTVDLHGGATPRVGEQPSYSWAVHTFDLNRYDLVATPTWYNITDKKTMQSTETFQSDKSYLLRAQFRLTNSLTDGFLNVTGNLNVVSSDLYETQSFWADTSHTKITVYFIFRMSDRNALITFQPKNGTGEMLPVTVRPYYTYYFPSCSFDAPGDGYEFDRWDKGKVGTPIQVTGDIVLKAQWKLSTQGKQEISSISIRGGKRPAKGEKPNYSWSVYSSDSTKYSIKSVEWYDATDRVPINENTVFMSGKRYTVILNCVPLDGYYFGEEVTAKLLNYDDGSYSTKIYPSSDHIDRSIYFTFSIGNPLWDLSAKIIRPKAGRTPSTWAAPGETFYTASVFQWYVGGTAQNPGSAMNSGTAFEAGKTYVAEVRIVPRSGYYIEDDATAAVNGIPAYFCGQDSSSTGAVYYRIAYTLPTSGNEIRSASASLSYPTAGSAPAAVAIAGSSAYSVTVNKWFVGGSAAAPDDEVMGENDVFEVGKTYVVSLVFTANATNMFADSITATINGVQAYLAGIDSATGSRTARVAFTVSAAGTRYTVSGTQTSFLNSAKPVRIDLIPSGTSEVAYSTTVTGNSGSYSIPNVAEGTYTLCASKQNHVTRSYTVVVKNNVVQNVKIHPLGDINGDGKITVLDVGKANSHAKGINLLTGYELSCADTFKSDGKVTATDVARINAHAKGTSLLW